MKPINQSVRYKTIVIDPPWKMNFMILKARPNQQKMPYDMMTLEQIKAFPINDYADKESVLFMWATMTTLPDSLEIVKHWGFKYHGVLAWHKNQGMFMFGIKRNVEFVIVAYKGKFIMKPKGKSIMASFKQDVKNHSEKPRVFYDMLLHSTFEPRIDIFSRKKHQGFDSWGNESEEPLTLMSYVTERRKNN